MTQVSAPHGILAFIRMRLRAFMQTPEQVFRRDAGSRFLYGPFPVEVEAVEEWQYALLSVGAYRRSNPKRKPLSIVSTMPQAVATVRRYRRTPATDVPDVDGELNAAGWQIWSDFPDQTLHRHMAISHLRAEVWENARQSLIVVAFGGTVFTSGKDWKSNLRWFLPTHKDEYTEIVERFGPDFARDFARRSALADGARLKNMQIHSTGHSLGGGLAQQFAYSLPVASVMPKVTKVYAFDPSPVTGYYSVKRAVRDSNRVGLQIVRTYQRGEVLAILRSFTSLVFKPSTVNPATRGVRFNLFPSPNPIAGHSIPELASRMRTAAESKPQDGCLVRS